MKQPPRPLPCPEVLANGPQPAHVSLRIIDLPTRDIILEVATPYGIVWPYLGQAHMRWLVDQLRPRLADIVPAEPIASTKDIIDALVANRDKKGM